ncbi:hypothetical protein E3N88_23633 [Mikania micrantha]|uniref:DUF7722 domain-containing protein n=1 Tax=Mikania micrantha TaxID=192012 RepID=A0A5N6NDW0_9ASTR|nr:hypothetical protein E3N88_23633 [Mikania micrantha]
MDDRRKNIATASHGGSGGSNFQMPLHYPRYTKEEYKELPEGMIDRLLAEYGLSSSGHHDLESKREFAIGAFLWPPQHVPGHHAGDLDHRCRLNMNPPPELFIFFTDTTGKVATTRNTHLLHRHSRKSSDRKQPETHGWKHMMVTTPVCSSSTGNALRYRLFCSSSTEKRMTVPTNSEAIKITGVKDVIVRERRRYLEEESARARDGRTSSLSATAVEGEIDERDADCEMSENEMPDVTGEGELSFAGCNVCERDNPMPPEIGREWEMPATEEQA